MYFYITKNAMHKMLNFNLIQRNFLHKKYILSDVTDNINLTFADCQNSKKREEKKIEMKFLGKEDEKA